MNKTYTFTRGEQIITIEAANYDEALDALISQVGGEEEAAEFTYRGE